MLYVTINETDLDDYQLLINLLKDNFIPYIKKFKKIECKNMCHMISIMVNVI